MLVDVNPHVIAHITKSSKSNRDFSLSLFTPYITVNKRTSPSPSIESTENGTIMCIISNERLEGVQLDIKEQCSLHAGRLEGCYSFTQGSQITFSFIPRNLLRQRLRAKLFSVESGPDNIIILLRLGFEKALVDSHCFTLCGRKDVLLVGILFYQSLWASHDVFWNESVLETSRFDCFHDFTRPSSPLAYSDKSLEIRYQCRSRSVYHSPSGIPCGLAVILFLFRVIWTILRIIFTMLPCVVELFVNTAVTRVRTTANLRNLMPR